MNKGYGRLPYGGGGTCGMMGGGEEVWGGEMGDLGPMGVGMGTETEKTAEETTGATSGGRRYRGRHGMRSRHRRRSHRRRSHRRH